jgi:ATP-dependent DNA helicase RecG
MFESAVREGKFPPDFGRSDAFHVTLRLNGKVQDEAFLRFLDRLAAETQRRFLVDDLAVLDAVHRGVDVPDDLKLRIQGLIDLGALERVGRSKLVLAKRFYAMKGMAGTYTRRKGLDRDTRKELLKQHIAEAGTRGAPFEELAQVLPDASRNDLKVLLRELKVAGQIHVRGVKRGARWCLGAGEGP